MAKKVVPRFKILKRGRTFLKEWRKFRGMTLEEAAEAAGMTAGNLSAMERGAQGYTQSGLEALARVYQANPGWLTDVDPYKQEDIFRIWESAKGADRQKIVDIARTIVGKIGAAS